MDVTVEEATRELVTAALPVTRGAGTVEALQFRRDAITRAMGRRPSKALLEAIVTCWLDDLDAQIDGVGAARRAHEARALGRDAVRQVEVLAADGGPSDVAVVDWVAAATRFGREERRDG